MSGRYVTCNVVKCSLLTSISYQKASNKCEYPVSSLVRFRPGQISAVTDSVPVLPEQWRPERTITSGSAQICAPVGYRL